MGDDRPPIYEEDGWIVHRASGLGNCIRNLVLARAGFIPENPPAVIQAAYDAGNAFEDRIVAEVAARQVMAIESTQTELAVRVSAKHLVRVHPDAILTRPAMNPGNGPTRKVLEVKAFAKSTYEKYRRDGLEGFPYYLWQWSCEMVATGLPGVYAIGVKCDCESRFGDNAGCDKCDRGLIDIHVLEYKTPPKSLEDIRDRVFAIQKAFDDFEAGEKIHCDIKQWPCGYYTMHDKEVGVWSENAGDGAGDKTLTAEQKTDLADLVEQYLDADKTAKQWAAVAAGFRGNLIEMLAGWGVRRGSAAGRHVTYSEFERAGSIDAAKLEKDGIDVDKYRKKATVVKQLRVTSEEENGDS